MTNKEISIRSIVFLIIGILLVLSLVICINIVNGEKDLVATNATVIKIKEDKDGTGKNDITAVYDVGNTTYQYNFYYKDDVKLELKTLEVSNYYRTVQDENNKKYKEYYYEFGKIIQGKMVYIKVKIVSRDNKNILCM